MIIRNGKVALPGEADFQEVDIRIEGEKITGIGNDASVRKDSGDDEKNTGSIETGKDADFALIDPEDEWRVRGKDLYSKGTVTPFEGMVFRGRVPGRSNLIRRGGDGHAQLSREGYSLIEGF